MTPDPYDPDAEAREAWRVGLAVVLAGVALGAAVVLAVWRMG